MNDKTGHLVFEYEMPSKFTEDLVKRVQNGNPAFQKELGKMVGIEVLEKEIRTLEADVLTEKKFASALRKNEAIVMHKLTRSKELLKMKDKQRMIVRKMEFDHSQLRKEIISEKENLEAEITRKSKDLELVRQKIKDLKKDLADTEDKIAKTNTA